jgi:thiol-disulfide isomerase/thioredoxin
MVVPMIVARVAVSPRFAETHRARASRHAAGSVRIDDVWSRAPSGCAPRTTRWRATHASSSLSSPRARDDARRRTIHRAFAITSAGAAVGSRVDQRSRSTHPADVETRRDHTVCTPVNGDARARRRVSRIDDARVDSIDSTTRDAELVRLPSGGAVAPWWAHGSDLANVADVRSAEEYAARMEEAKAMAFNASGKPGKPLVVCVEFFAGWCFACRSLHPKMTKIASEEFADVLFLRVRKDECPSLCDAMGVEKLPYVHLVSIERPDATAPKIADAFAMNLTAPKLRKLRAGLETHARGGGERREPAAWHKVHKIKAEQDVY